MLKIKKDVKFEELKEFGFTENGINDKTYVKRNPIKEFGQSLVISSDNSRMIYFTVDNGKSWLPIDDSLFDLIQAGYIEKVEV